MLYAEALIEELFAFLESWGINLIAREPIQMGEYINLLDLCFDVGPHIQFCDAVDDICNMQFIATAILSIMGVPDLEVQCEVDNHILHKGRNNYTEPANVLGVLTRIYEPEEIDFLIPESQT